MEHDVDRDRLTRLLGMADLAWLVKRMRRRMERGEPLDTTVTLSGATPDQRAAVTRLLGRRARPGSTLSVSLPAVEEVLRRSGIAPGGLTQAVVALTGPVTLRAEFVAAEERGWRAAFAPLDEVVDARPELGCWLERIRASGQVRRVAGTHTDARPLLADLAEVIRNLPAHGEPIGRFAARVAGGAHALDDDRSLATLALGAARVLEDLPEGSGAEWRREVWAGVGLLRDELSATVLTLGLPGDARTATGRALGTLSEAGQPAVLTLRQLVRDAPDLAVSGQIVSVCENPVVVASAAERLGSACAPLVCTSGQPGAAAMHLLRLAQRRGATLQYHGDFDWGGIRIGNVLFDRLSLRPWRFDAAPYRAAVERHQGRKLTGASVEATWDAGLRAAMTDAGQAIEEELVLDDLLADLGVPEETTRSPFDHDDVRSADGC